MIGDNASLVGVVTDAAQSAFGMLARFCDAQPNAIGRHPETSLLAASRRSGSRRQRKTGLRAAVVSSRRRRGVKTGAAWKRDTSPERAAPASAFSTSTNRSSDALLSVSVGSISIAPCTISGKYIVIG